MSSMQNTSAESKMFGSSKYSRRHFSSPKTKSHTDEPCQSDLTTRIPGFDISPERNDIPNSLKPTDIDMVEAVNDYDFAEIAGGHCSNSKLKEKKFTDVNINDSFLLTPKNKIRSYDEEIMTPLPDISYQAAILESMEQSALKVRNDDSFLSELDESPFRTPKREQFKDGMEKDHATGTKRRQDYDDDKLSHKIIKRDDKLGLSDDDDEEESALIIDLSPCVKSSRIDMVWIIFPA